MQIANCRDGQIQLDSGDIIIYYTDGFTDAANQSGVRFDESLIHPTYTAVGIAMDLSHFGIF